MSGHRRVARARRWLAVMLVLVVPGLAHAHEPTMAVLALKEVRASEYLGQWVLSPDENTDQLHIVFPSQCTWDPPALDCGRAGLAGTIGFEGLGSKMSAVMVRVTSLDGSTQSYMLTAATPQATVVGPNASLVAATLALADTYINLGIDHILLGIDHLLFVLGLIWLVRGGWRLFKTITAFTVAHSVSLALATFGVLRVPEQPLNAVIALSIVFVGVEIVRLHRGERGLTARAPWAVAFAFGLLHGLGFASALTALGIARETLLPALLFFNVGVEIGQVGFVMLVLAVQWALRRLQLRGPRWSVDAPAYAIGAVATFWFIGRMAKLVG